MGRRKGQTGGRGKVGARRSRARYGGVHAAMAAKIRAAWRLLEGAFGGNQERRSWAIYRIKRSAIWGSKTSAIKLGRKGKDELSRA